MSFDLNSINKGACVKAPRIQILGDIKIGKTSFAAGYCNQGRDKTADTDTTLIIPISGETGADGLDVDKTDPVESFDKLREILEWIATQEHHYNRIVIDSTSALGPIINDHVCAINGNAPNVRKIAGFRVGEAAVDNCWVQVTKDLDKLRARGIVVFLVSHVIVKGFNDPTSEKYDRYQTDLEANAAGIVSKWCDMILFAKTDKIMRTEEAGFGEVNRKRADQVNTTRWIYTRATPTTPGGVRPEYAKLPEKLELDWAIFRAAVGDCLSQS